jgi:hypothetical protein
MGPAVDVAIPRPRTAALLQHDDEALRARTHVIECLTDYVKHAKNRPRRKLPATASGPAIVTLPMENES